MRLLAVQRDEQDVAGGQQGGQVAVRLEGQEGDVFEAESRGPGLERFLLQPLSGDDEPDVLFPGQEPGRLEDTLQGHVAADADRPRIKKHELVVEAVFPGNRIVLRHRREKVRVHPVGNNAHPGRGHSLGQEVPPEPLADDHDTVRQPVDPFLETLGEPDARRARQDSGLDGQVRMDVLDAEQHPGAPQRPGPEGGQAQLERRRPQEEDVGLRSGREVQHGAGRVNVPGGQTGGRMRRRVRPHPLHDEAVLTAPGIGQPGESAGPLARQGGHDLDFVAPSGQVAGQLVHEDGRAPEVGKKIHGVDRDSHRTPRAAHRAAKPSAGSSSSASSSPDVSWPSPSGRGHR